MDYICELFITGIYLSIKENIPIQFYVCCQCLQMQKILVAVSLTDGRGAASSQAYNYSRPMCTTQCILTWDDLMNARLRESLSIQCNLLSLVSFFSLFIFSLYQPLSLSFSLTLTGRWRAAAVVGCEGASGMCVWVCVCVWGAGYSHPSMTGISSPSISELHTPFKPAVLCTNTRFCLYSA